MLETIEQRHLAHCTSSTQAADAQAENANDGISKTESLLALGAAIATTFVVRRLLMIGWRGAFDREPPKNPAAEDVAWREAVLWGCVSGAMVGTARIVARRTATGLYRR